MNNKIFATALFALAAFVSTGASAAGGVIYSNSVGVGAQTDDAVVNVGTSGRANDLYIEDGDGGLLPADSEVIIRLPAGLNFSGAPTYLVTPDVENAGLTLKDDTIFGDATLGADAGVQLFDTNADGGMDRALVTVSAESDAGDLLVISLAVTADADATVGTTNVSIIVNGGLAQTVPLVVVVDEALSGVISSTGDDLVGTDQSGNGVTVVNSAAFAVIIPAGAEDGDTVLIDVAGNVQFNTDATTPTLTIAEVLYPLSIVPLTGTSLIEPVTAATGTITLTVQGAPDDGFAYPVVLIMVIDEASLVEGQAAGDVGVTVSGTAGVTGAAALFSVKVNGSSAALATGALLTSIVSDGTAPQELPAITITENFDGDALNGTGTITITAGAGLAFSAGQTATISVTAGDGATYDGTGGTSTGSVIVLPLTDTGGGTLTITISGILATASAEGNLSVTVGGVGIDSATGPEGDVVSVATGVPVGTVSVTGPTTLTKVGVDGTNSVDIVLAESTYGSISRANFLETTTSTGTETQEAYFRVTPTNADIDDVTLFVGYDSGAPTFGEPCEVESAGAAAWVCIVSTESSALLAGTDTVTVTVDYTADGIVGDTVSFAVDGNAAIEGTVDAATIVIATTATSGALPILEEGSTEAQLISTLTITENAAGSIEAGVFRLIAPAGIVFDDEITDPDADWWIMDTFGPSDTLVMGIAGGTQVLEDIYVKVDESVSGYISFEIVDGDGTGDDGENCCTNITPESIDLAYADKSLTAIDAGADVAVNIGYSASNDVSGGLGPWTVGSGSTPTATVTLVGGVVTVTGVAAGAATITLTDALGGTATFDATVSAPTAIPASVKGATGAARTGASFLTGATADGGNTYGDTFTTADDVTIVGTVNVDPVDQDLDGAIHIAIKSDNADGVTLSYLDEDGVFMTWDPAGLPGAHIVAEPLTASYDVTIYSGTFAAGTYRIALAYTNENGDLVYTGKAIVITVTE